MQNKVRVMWLLNHITLRGFELEMMRSICVNEIFTPKIFPYDEGNLSANVTYEYDEQLTIPNAVLDLLNKQNWYESPSLEAWEAANKYFDIAVIGVFPKQIASTIKNFKGQVVLRAFGLSKGHSYTNLLENILTPHEFIRLHKLRNRFWFGTGYAHLKDEEGDYLKSRNCFLPVGITGELQPNQWNGSINKIFFVCPRINTSSYYKNIYYRFKENFKRFDYLIGGAQPIAVDDEKVLGYVPIDTHEYNMRELKVMFYHSTEPNHIHYHPFEAIKNGMPLIYMSNGILDMLAGKKLPGSCKTIKEAQKKIQKIFQGDIKFINAIRSSQSILLEQLKAENCYNDWKESFEKIILQASCDKIVNTEMSLISLNKKKRIAVIIPVAYSGGSLRAAKMLSEAIYKGSIEANEEIEVVLGYLDLEEVYSDLDFADIHPAIKKRPYRWKHFDIKTSKAIFKYSNLPFIKSKTSYFAPDDSINYFTDCDLLVIISDRLEHKLLPITPYILVIYDYLQRYENILNAYYNEIFISAANNAEKVIVTTDFTKNDALNFAGLHLSKIAKCPSLTPIFTKRSNAPSNEITSFIWTTNLGPHKNHENSFEALRIYYEEMDGKLNCKITGVNTDKILTSEINHLKNIKKIIKNSKKLQKCIEILGELSNTSYQNVLSTSAFLWHTTRIDNGTFSVLEAASLGVPSLSSYYPAMLEMDAEFNLNMLFMNPWDPIDMANKLKIMETEALSRRKLLYDLKNLEEHNLNSSIQYWKVIRESL